LIIRFRCFDNHVRGMPIRIPIGDIFAVGAS
jgi:hypothetical protein